MKNKLIILISVAVLILVVVNLSSKIGTNRPFTQSPTKVERTWQVKSIDTMKYSRDLSLEKLNDPTFDTTIDSQIKAVKDTGANYVAIATPYDERFYPMLTRWVEAARRYNLKIWFRGNFSGWEGWFGETRSLLRQKHLEMTRAFIQNHPNLFRDGDIFSPCPECENGGPGDPRQGGIDQFRKFMIDEHKAAGEEFKKIKKQVATNFASMNFDVASLVMDADTTAAMDNLIVIDHYVRTPEKLASDIDNLSKKTGAQIFLGEFGAPIPDITGPLNQEGQANWYEKSLNLVSKRPAVIGINCWVAVGGETAIFNDDASPKPAAEVVKKYFTLTKYD